MNKPVSSQVAKRLRRHALCETSLGRKIRATDHPFDPKAFPPGAQRLVAQKVLELQQDGVFVDAAQGITPRREIRHDAWQGNLHEDKERDKGSR